MFDRKEQSTSMSQTEQGWLNHRRGAFHKSLHGDVRTLQSLLPNYITSDDRLPFNIVGYSLPCERHPQRNEDSFLIEQHSGLIAVFDGVGEAGTDDLATTVAIAALCHHPGKNEFNMVYAHVGDSRVYLLKKGEPLQRLTIDDGLLGKLIENEIVNEEDARRIDQAMHAEDLTDAEISYFRMRGGITQALGGPLPPEIHIDQIPIAIGDRILLCTDGIHDNLTDLEIEEILRKAPRNAAARLLVEYALLRSREERQITIRAKPDDMTAIVLTRRY